MLAKYSVLLLIVMFTFSLSAHSQHSHHHDDVHDHDHLRNEFGGAVGAVFNLNENNLGTGIHVHYMRMLGGKLDNFGLAPGFEFILGEHKHFTLHFLFLYRPIHQFWIGLGPGATYFEHDDEVRVSGHVEVGYEFDLGKVHLGPVIEYARAKEDQHIMIGVHLGIPF